jgi:hypothetical protein
LKWIIRVQYLVSSMYRAGFHKSTTTILRLSSATIEVNASRNRQLSRKRIPFSPRICVVARTPKARASPRVATRNIHCGHKYTNARRIPSRRRRTREGTGPARERILVDADVRINGDRHARAHQREEREHVPQSPNHPAAR